MRGKLSTSHLQRRALVYVRQSTAAQVMEHGESTKRQYALADRALSLEWSREAIEVIDEDQGKSGASTKGRTGFARLAHAVAHGEVGAVLAVEVSRLARCSEDWRRLLSLCAVAECAVIDEQTIYDAANSDDKLLLDLKGTMSEAELQWLGLRMTGARLSKARRGALRTRPPTGYVWAEHGLELDPDEAVQEAVRGVLERYAIEPSAWAVVRWARDAGVLFPTRHFHSGGASEVTWKPLGATTSAGTDSTTLVVACGREAFVENGVASAAAMVSAPSRRALRPSQPQTEAHRRDCPGGPSNPRRVRRQGLRA